VSRVLVIDDEPQILRAMSINLSVRGHEVFSASTGLDALSTAAHQTLDLVILDLGLPDVDGLDVIRGLRDRGEVPIIILSGRTQNETKIAALDAGADDYVTKPFHMDELLARVRAVTRRSAHADEAGTVRLGDVVVDLRNRTVRRPIAEHDGHGPDGHGPDGPGQDIHLTRTEWQIVDMLLTRPGTLVTQKQLLNAIRGPGHSTETHYLRQFMTQIRHKLEPDPSRPRYLLTEPGMGYRFKPERAAS
jgi:two-component system, OmpR family, KDP operon response regulator KdpE